MAARKFSRAAPAPVRPRPSSALKAAPAKLLPEAIRQHLQSLLAVLRDIEGTVIVVAHALREEEGLVGMCAARVLRVQVSDRLSLEAERAMELFSIELQIRSDIEQ